ncbi:MAG: enoyl-CoA hydratase/isomerase family protein [Betaproteobacteria bacterium]|jgi:enoyl-CoA hydratase/carnithine racemase|nr:MAG: enoyl-CoA hydratase/isomerase family protein [Betaproteobacteria bacterium]
MASTLNTELCGSTFLITLNRPKSFNAINNELRSALIETLEQANTDHSVRAIVITGAGDQAFCSGQDLEETSRYGIDDLEAWLTAAHAMYRGVRALDKPAVAAFNGVAAGAGFQIGLCCDMRVGYPEMRIGQPEIKAGLASIVGTTLMAMHIGVGHNTELSLSGDLISGRRAYEIGLLNRLVTRESVLDTAVDLAGELAKRAPAAMRLTKQRFRALTDDAFESALPVAIETQKRAYTSGEPQAAMQKFLQRKK